MSSSTTITNSRAPYPLLPNAIDDRARSEPKNVFARIPKSSSYTDGFRPVTNSQMATAINFVARLFISRFGPPQHPFETIAYLGPTDPRYTIVIVAAMKAGYKAFLPSPRNSQQAQLSLMEACQCSKLVSGTSGIWTESLSSIERSAELLLPSIDELFVLNSSSVKEITFDYSYDDIQHDPMMVLHTSGSTGTPKPLFFTHEWINRSLQAYLMPAPEGYEAVNHKACTGTYLATIPPFHIAGVITTLMVSATTKSIPVYPIAGPPPSLSAIVSAVKNCPELDWAFIAPSLVNELGQSPDALKYLASRIKYVMFAGGSVPTQSGNVVASQMGLHSVFGSSECGPIPLLKPLDDPDYPHEWHYLHVHPDSGIEFQHRSEDLYEMVVVKQPHDNFVQPVFSHFDIPEYATKDLFRKHLTKPDMWTHASRLDDVIVFSTGEKTNPITFEQEVGMNPEVSAALVIGAQRFEASLLVEPRDNSVRTVEDKGGFIEKIWPTVEAANMSCPKHARVSKEKIMLTDPAKPMARAAKGTVQRQQTIDLYSAEIDELYKEDEDVEDISSGAELPAADQVVKTVHDAVSTLTHVDSVDDTDDFFSIGMDSLQALQLRRVLKKSLPASHISVGDVYAHPTVNLLAESISNSGTQSPANGIATKNPLEETLVHYLAGIDAVVPSIKDMNSKTSYDNTTPLATQERFVLLTGSTGALGSEILDALYNNSNWRIFCFNRGADSEKLQIQRSKERKLTTQFNPDRVTFLTGDLAKPNFGLEANTFNQLLYSVTNVIHNAWPVDFNKSLLSFGKTLDGVLGLISFATNSRLNPKIQFTSSISATGSYQASSDTQNGKANQLVPESIIIDSSCCLPMGYGQSKYIAERMLGHASNKLHLNTEVIRLGQIAGSSKTRDGWNRNEWLPSIVISSSFIGALPDELGSFEDVDWVPIDQTAQVIVELAGASEAGGDEGVVSHLVHPKPLPWSALLPTLESVLNYKREKRMAVVPYAKWVESLRASGDGMDMAQMSKRNPAIKLLSFFEEMATDGNRQAKLDQVKTLERSRELQKMEPLKMEWVAGWAENWLKSSK
ncbi:putative AMP dependent ligase/synthetase [Venturia nashicola]|uniref:Putative AMP dependent ligase/synthetase n=1 Tax=Venturia nashicola TaxID=86259 RepID=A0A4Z1PAR5_9PEZI|nr:putative AMP dependent ligase/synthetase [Venturia nashicola]TLD29368.1 putative AMP dependent ligase/synthetase [Venturia nashicola]